MKRSAWLILALAMASLTGCVTKRYVITSDPPGAIVYRNGQPIGATPCEESFTYYGKYHFRLVKDGKQAQDVVVEFCPPWYEYPPLDFIFENIIPYTWRDIKPVHVQLFDEQLVPEDQVRMRAEELRQRGREIASPLAGQPRQRPGRPQPVVLPAKGTPQQVSPTETTGGNGLPQPRLLPPRPITSPPAPSPGAP